MQKINAVALEFQRGFMIGEVLKQFDAASKMQSLYFSFETIPRKIV